MPTTDSGLNIDQRVIDSYVMPTVISGTTVRFWRTGVPTRDCIAATVLEVGRRTVELVTATGYRSRDARHVTDPKLMLNENMREGGCWDFTEHYVRGEEFRDATESRLSKLEDTVARLTVSAARVQDEPPRDKKPSGFVVMSKLRQEAAAMGLSFDKDISMEALRNLVDTARISRGLSPGNTEPGEGQ